MDICPEGAQASSGFILTRKPPLRLSEYGSRDDAAPDAFSDLIGM